MVFTASSLPEGHNDGVENDVRFPELTLQLVCLAGSNHKPGSGGIFIGGCFSKYRFPAAFRFCHTQSKHTPKVEQVGEARDETSV